MPIQSTITADSLLGMLRGSSAKTSPAAPAPAAAPGASGDIPSIVKGAARRYGVPEDLALRMTGAESSGNANAQNSSSSAGGLYQFLDKTWNNMGGSPGKKYDPVENADVGSRYTRQNIDALHRKLGRDITYGEAYAAHMFGDGVSKMIAKSPSSAPIESGLSKFNSPDQVDRIMQSNPNLRGKTVGQVMQGLESKVGQGVIPRPAKLSDASEDVPQDTQVASADEYRNAWESPDQDQEQDNIA
jgi:hypothetical protein